MDDVAAAGPLRRSLLFLPATRPDRFPKALASGADAVCLDLEDAVPPADKDGALATVLELLGAHERTGVEVAVRVNEVAGERGAAELRALGQADVALDTVLLPKVTGPDEVRRAAELLGERRRAVGLVPLVESARGLARIDDIAAASPRVTALMLGAIDLCAELGAAVEWDALLHARSRTVLAAALAGVQALDTPSLDVADLHALEAETRAVARLGFTAKAAIHPAQVPVIHRAFRPTAETVEKARRIVAASEASRGGPVLVDGRMVDAPVVRAARRTVALAERAEAGHG